MFSRTERRIFAGLLGLALAAGSAHALPTVYVDPATGDDSNDGSNGSPVATITNALTKVDSAGTIELAAGTYTERFWANIDVTIQGPAVNPPTAIVRPALQSPLANLVPENDEGLIELGSTGVTRNITIKNITINGSNFTSFPNLSLSGGTRFALLHYRSGTNLTAENITFTDLLYSPGTIGTQNNMGIRGVFGNGSTVSLTGCTFTRYNKNAVAVFTADNATATFNVTNCSFTGADPIVSFPNNQNSQSMNSLQYWAINNGVLNGTVTGCTFQNSPPSGHGGNKAALNYFKCASDNTIGYAILDINTAGGVNNVNVTGNTFTNCVGAAYFYTPGKMTNFVSNNTFTGGLIYSADSSSVPYGDSYNQYANTPDLLNYGLYWCGDNDKIIITPGTYDLPRGMTSPNYTTSGSAVIDSPSGPATIRFTGATPADVTAGTNVTFVPNYAFPDTDGDGAADALELMYYSDPNDIDTDNDGYDDGVEIKSVLAGDGSNTGINPRIAAARWGNVYLDSDGDGCPNIVDPGTGADFDGDGFSDRYEVAQGTDSNNVSVFPSLGDVNGTGLTDNNDASVVFNYYLGNVGAPSNLSRGDIDRNGTVDYVDAVILFNWSLVPKRVPYLSYPK